LVTAALPYANGSIHLGHMLEFVQTDVYVRARKLAGEDVIFMWADDTHGTPVQVRARKEGISPEELIARAYDEHVQDFQDFGLAYDIFHTTHSEENRKHAGIIFEAMKAKGDIISRNVAQLFCPNDTMFLPDRFVRGTCPKCKTPDQYGDVCENCGTTYAPTELIEPKCSICATTPELRDSEHLFVPLARHEEFLRKWLNERTERGDTRLPPSVKNYVMNWVEDGLRDWDISRDKPYFGWEIPGHPGKYFYVWFDAPIGYIAATDKWCQQSGKNFDDYWHSDDTEIVHFIGKDIVYFHCLFWPAMLNAAGYTTPCQVQVHGWLTVNGEKMSKTRGTFILARTYLDHLPAYYLRYYYAAKLSSGQDDFDVNMEDFANRVNADLVNKAANLASRCIKFLTGRLDGKLADPAADGIALLEKAEQRLGEIPEMFRKFEFAKAMRTAMEIAEDINVYVTEKAPWKIAKTDTARAKEVLSVGVHASKLVGAILTAVIPEWGEKLQRTLNLSEPLNFANAVKRLPAGHALGEYEALAERIDTKKLDAIIEASRETMGEEEASAGSEHDYEVPELQDEVKIEDFTPLDLRVGVVESCEEVEGSKKLLLLTVDLGPLGKRNIFSGIRPSYPKPEVLLGKRVAVFANLKPRKMRFGTSEGMVLASGSADDDCTVLELAETAKPGEKIT
jgi:methionyl-tRNA synthetase